MALQALLQPIEAGVEASLEAVTLTMAIEGEIWRASKIPHSRVKREGVVSTDGCGRLMSREWERRRTLMVADKSYEGDEVSSHQFDPVKSQPFQTRTNRCKPVAP